MSLDKLRKNLAKKNIITEMNEPTNWISLGNATLNYRLSGRMDIGLPNKRSLLLWGESGTGKTYLASNTALQAQQAGYKIIYLDSEDSISEDYMEKVGIDLSPEWFVPVTVDTIEEATEALSVIFDTMSPDEKFILIIDSLAGLMSEKELKEFEKGESKGDMGQIAKRLKLLVKNVNKKIGDYDAFCIMVSHAYQNQDMLNGEGRWICTGGKGFQFFPSFSIKLEKAKLRDGDRAVVNGVKIKAEVTKTRFTAPFQTCVLEVPYDRGIDPLEGVLDIFQENGVVGKNGAWYNYSDKDGELIKFQRSAFEDHYENLLEIFNEKFLEDLVESDTPELESE